MKGISALHYCQVKKVKVMKTKKYETRDEIFVGPMGISYKKERTKRTKSEKIMICILYSLFS